MAAHFQRCSCTSTEPPALWASPHFPQGGEASGDFQRAKRFKWVATLGAWGWKEKSWMEAAAWQLARSLAVNMHSAPLLPCVLRRKLNRMLSSPQARAVINALHK